MNPIVFDIETIANPDVISYLPEIKPKANLKDPVKIKADIKEKEAKRKAELCLDPLTSRICVFGYKTELEYGTIFNDSEPQMLMEIWDILKEHDYFITFNGVAFDVPMLHLHSMRCQVAIPVKIGLERHYVNNHADMRLILGGFNPYAKGTLDMYAKVLLRKGKTEGMDATKIQEYWDAGRVADIAGYCLNDVDLTYELHELWKKISP